MLQRFSTPLPSQQSSSLSFRRQFGQFRESQTFSTGFQDSSSGFFCELQSAYTHLWHNEHSLVIENLSHEDQDAVSLLVGAEFGQFGDGHGITGHSALFETFVYDAVERGVGSTGEELVELDKKLVVLVGAGRRSVVSEFVSAVGV